MLSEDTMGRARLLWEYHHVNHSLQQADCILVLGSHDTRVAIRGAELWLKGWAPWLIFSGGLGRLTREMWKEPEARKFANIAMELGVPAEAILVEDRSTNTGENVVFTQKMLKQLGLEPRTFILVQKPYMERRSWATFQKQWPDKTCWVTSPQLSFDEYPTKEIPLKQVISIMVGDLQRIRLYSENGFQVPQTIPPEVWEAYKALVAEGFDEQLIPIASEL